jgi:hypothetical protein
MKTGELKAKSLAQLRDYAAELDVVGRQRMNKGELIEAILAAKAKVAARQEQRSSRPLSAKPAPARAVSAGKTAKPVAKPAPAAKAAPAKPVAKPAPVAKAAPAKPVAKPAPVAKAAPAKPVAKPAPVAKAAPAKPVAKPAPVAKAAPAKPVAKPAPVAKAAPAKPVAKSAPAAKSAPVKPVAKPARTRLVGPAEEAPPRRTVSTAAKPAVRTTPRKVTPGATKALGLQVKTLQVRKLAGKKVLPEPEPPRPSRKPRAGRTYPLSPAPPSLNLKAGILPGELPKPPAAGPDGVAPARKAQTHAQASPPMDYLPTIYQDDRVVLLARDPQWLYCYWEFSSTTMNAIRDSLARNGGNMVLRVHDVTGVSFDGLNSLRFEDLELPEQASGNWYFQSLGGDVEHMVEVGIRARDGRFVAFARSNPVRTPRAVEGPIVAIEQVKAEEQAAAAAQAADKPGAKKGAAAGRGVIAAVPAHPSSPAGPIGAHGVHGAAGAAPTSPGGPLAPTSPGLGFGHVPGSVVPREIKEREFWLVVDAELIVYGATVPGAKVTLQGQPIALRPDGTFSARFALPDGRQEIPVAATSPDEVDHKVITPVVERQTRESD